MNRLGRLHKPGSPGLLPRFLARFLGETRSITALEFALIGPVVLLFIFLILLTGIVQFWQLALDDAVRNAARQVAIGAFSATAGIHSAADFTTTICNEFGQAAPSCATRLQFSVQGGAEFTGAGGIVPATISSGGVLSTTATFTGVTIREPFLIQVVYPVPFSIPFVPMGLVTLNGRPSLISAVVGMAS